MRRSVARKRCWFSPLDAAGRRMAQHGRGATIPRGTAEGRLHDRYSQIDKWGKLKGKKRYGRPATLEN